jgi:DNA-binding GntR family transcriptional regulator
MGAQVLDRSANRPLYLQLADCLRTRISEGEWAEGTRLPALEDLLTQYEVRAPVVERALDLLKGEGWLRWDSRQRQWIATQPRPVQGVVMAWDPAASLLEGAACLEVRVLTKAMTTLSREMLRTFEVHGRDGNRANRILKHYLSADQPLALETILSPISTLPGLLMKDHRHENLYRMVESHYRKRVERLEQRTHVRPLTSEEAGWLRSAEEFPALCIDRTLFGAEGAIATSQWVLVGGRCSFIEEASRLS